MYSPCHIIQLALLFVTVFSISPGPTEGPTVIALDALIQAIWLHIR